MDILLTGRLDAAEREAWLAALRAALPQAGWIVDMAGDAAEPDWRDAATRAPVGAQRLQAVELAVVASPAPRRLQGMPRLKLIQSLWAGVDRLLDDATLPAGVPIARMVDPAMNAAMAETALWATLTLHRHYQVYAAQQRAGRWHPLPQRRADEVAVTVLGHGQMGRSAARRLAAQGYRVSAWRLSSASAGAQEGVEVVSGIDVLPALLARSDIVVNLLPLTPATRGLIDARFLAALPAGAGLVNLARGAQVVEPDLLAALDAGRLAHAVLDVFAVEPLPAQHPFWTHPRVTVLPHAAASTDVRSAAAVAVANLRAALAGEPVAHAVDRRRGY